MKRPRPNACLRDADWLDARRARAWLRIAAAVQISGLLGLLLASQGGLDRKGDPVGTDFVSFWTAARLAASGAAGTVYDPAAHHAAEQAFFGAYFGWYAFFYPPVFLLYLLPLATLPYFAALATWLGASGFFYLRALRAFARNAFGALPALVFPAVFVTLGHGQNALLTTALFTAGASCLETRPWLAGALFGLLSYKPQLALILPLGLAVARRWQALAAMAASALALAGLSLALFGAATWRSFFAEAPLARATLEQGLVEPEKMQSLFAAIRMWGGGPVVAYAAQGLLAAGAALLLVAILRRTTEARAQGAAMAAATLLATPFLLDYDLMLMAVPMAWIYARARTEGFLPYEKTVLLTAYAAPLFARPLAQHAHLPVGLFASCALFALLARRLGKEGATRKDKAAGTFRSGGSQA